MLRLIPRRLPRAAATNSAARAISVPTTLAQPMASQPAARRLGALASHMPGRAFSASAAPLAAAPAAAATSNAPHATQATDPEVVARKVGNARLLILNRPKALNALSTGMCLEMAKYVNVGTDGHYWNAMHGIEGEIRTGFRDALGKVIVNRCPGLPWKNGSSWAGWEIRSWAVLCAILCVIWRAITVGTF